MNNNNSFPDQIHIDQIRKRLWFGREYGQAAIMVGSGFSRNASKVSQSVDAFPLWSEVAETLFDRLYPLSSLEDKDPVKTKLRATSGVGAMKLAQEYVEVFGRQDLNDLLAEAIPDNQYAPGRLHQLLLSLPWSDVFTTNYDTLLERTRPLIHNRYYDVVIGRDHIPGSMKPRIVKLHGSFPSYSSAIITEEDYRTYPQEYAPFVNMVQQSLMENTLCLIGFSGDDPNFLYWSGWVRDNLGINTPSIYLCGLLGLSNSQRRVLEKKRIIPIDLGPLFDKSEWSDPDMRYAKALEWFLLNLLYGAPPHIMDWPIPMNLINWKPSEGLPHLPEPKQLSDPGEIHFNEEVNELELTELCKTWRQTRLEYPGWIIAPKENREQLWVYTKDSIEPVLSNTEKLPPLEQLSLIYELNWRLERALIPLISETDWSERYASLLEMIDPFPTILKLEKAEIKPDKQGYQAENWKQIAEYWVELAFALARKARESQDEGAFLLWVNRIQSVSSDRNEWRMRAFYEECLFYLSCFDFKKLISALHKWPVISELPFWQIKRAALLAEIGELREAEEIAETALNRIRTRHHPHSTDFLLLSQEGYAMLVLQVIKGSDFKRERDFLGPYRDRWEKLRTYRCNPWPEIDIIRSIIKQPCPVKPPVREIIKSFDPGYRREVEHYIRDSAVSRYLQAFAFHRMLEEAGIPIKSLSLHMYTKDLVNAAKWIAPVAPLRCLNSILRAGKLDDLKEWFDRIRVATLTQTQIDHIYNFYIGCLKEVANFLSGKESSFILERESIWESQIILLCELFSRLSIRLNTERLKVIFDISMSLYIDLINRPRHFLHHNINILFKRLLEAMPESLVLEKIPEMLSLPTPSETEKKVRLPELWAEPLNFIFWFRRKNLETGLDRSKWAAPISKLTLYLKVGSAITRNHAATRLVALHEINALTPEQKEAIGDALWSRLDPAKGLPSETNFSDSSFLHLPQPSPEMAKENLRRYLLSEIIPSFSGKSMFGNSREKNYRYIEEINRATTPLFSQDDKQREKFIDWTPEESVLLLRKVQTWWNETRDKLSTEDGQFKDELKGAFWSRLMELISGVLLPRLANAGDEETTIALTMLLEMEQCGLCILSPLPVSLFIRPDSYDDITRKLRLGLISLDIEEVSYSILGIFFWLAYSSKGGIAPPPPDLLNEWVNRIVGRRQPALAFAIGQISVVINNLPDFLTEDQLEKLCLALGYLHRETRLPDNEELEIKCATSPTIPIEELPEYRSIAANLAYTLFVYHRDRNKVIPDILLKWQETCQTDVLPEVRRAWGDNWQD